MMDTLSSWLQVLTTQELKVYISLIWCWYGKICLLAYFLVLFEDRKFLILRYCAVSALTTFTQSCVMTSLVHQYITEGQVLDWFKVYVTIVLDVPFHVKSVYAHMTRSK